MNRHANKLALLVGSNPLPNYLAAVMLAPREVVLVYSPKTRDPRDHLRAALERRNITVSEVCIDDATDARKIRDACAGLAVDHLHYSGGTKPMAAHARQACTLAESQATYLDERKGVLRFDDGYDIRLDQHELGLTLDLLLKLHGIERVAPTESEAEGAPTDDDLSSVALSILRNPKLADRVRQQLRPKDKPRSITEAQTARWRPEKDGFLLSASVIPDEDWTNARYKTWDEFLTGGWLEAWTARLIRTCLDGSTTAVDVNVHCRRARPSPTEFEIDVALIRGHRLHVVSCTTHQKKALCKSKLFEVAMRARQMGGDLARSALVSLLDGSDAKGAYVDQLRADIASVWDAPNVPRVFGLADLREWAGTAGAPNLSSLKEWLDS
jgi:hypothetical protein